MEKSNDVGSLLKAERERRGLTLDVVQEATKIPIDSLKAIEEGYKIRTLTSFYYKSFVRLYAQHLGLDPLPILAMIPSYQPIQKIVTVERPEVISKPDLRKLKIIAGPTASFAWRRAVPVVLGVLAALLVIGGVVALVRHAAEKKAPVVEVKGAKAVKGEKVSKSEKMPKATALPSEVKKVEPVSAEVKAVKKVLVGVRAGVTAWLTVKSDGGVVFSGSLKKGSYESWQAVKKIEISGKELEQLEYEINGKPVGRLGRRDAKIRRVVVTPEGLSVDK